MKTTEVSKSSDDFDAVRIIVGALERFEPKDQERILRWAREKIGLTSSPTAIPVQMRTPSFEKTPEDLIENRKTPRDIKSFVEEKKPLNDIQFAAVVAYYYQFEAPENQRKIDISADDLIEACRLAKWRRPKQAPITLNNAKLSGLIDKSERGRYKINSVGENLVAMTLPQSGPSGEINGRAKNRGKSNSKTKSKSKKR